MKKYWIFLAACVIACVLPFAGMAVCPSMTSTENKELSAFPVLRAEDGSWNLEFFQEFEQYFQEHFAFRNELVYADAKIQTSLFQTSNHDSVICGKDGWLYYASTLGDYLGDSRMSDRQIYSLAHNLSLVSRYVEGKGSGFVLAVPPNKNTLYGENMPYYDSWVVDDVHNIDLLEPKLQELGVPYADLTGMFREAAPELLYLKRDSHWNQKGALMAYNCIMDTLGYVHQDYGDSPITRAKDEDGDLNRMLYTFYGEKELNYRYEIGQEYTYTNDPKSVEDVWIETEGGTGNGSLLMFRDSFGNTLIPLIAGQFEKAWFTKEVPYGLESLMEQHEVDTVIFEKVERNLAEYIRMPPVISAMEAELPQEASQAGPEIPGSDVLDSDGTASGASQAGSETSESDVLDSESTASGASQQKSAVPDDSDLDASDSNASISVELFEFDANYYKISGTIGQEFLEEETDIFVRVNGVCYAPYYTGDNGFEMYIKKEKLRDYPLEIAVLAEDQGICRVVQEKKVDEGEILQ